MSKKEETSNLSARQINFPSFTWDYRLVNGENGLGLAANRNIRKGELVFSDSYEFLFADVREGDVLRFDRYEKANRRSQEDVPATLALTHDLLTRTHGVPSLKPANDDKTAGVVSWHLETPGMLINHSCDPNIIDDSHDESRGEAYAARDIKRGEELTYDYTFQYYDHGPFFETCRCGTDKCRGNMMGFKALTDEQKKEALPKVSEAVKAMYEAETGKGLPVKKQQVTYPPRVASDGNALRLVVPGPSHAAAPVLLRKNEESGALELYAGRDFKEGDQVYEFWTQSWPGNSTHPIDMIFSRNLEAGDPEEGTVVRVNALELAKRDRKGVLIFSGFDLFTAHSCNPNMVYNDKTEDEDDDWRGTYASRTIQRGDLLSVDLNTIHWDRTEWEGLGDGTCTCGAPNCRGLVKGFKFLTEDAQEELKSLSWKRSIPPHPVGTQRKKFVPGEALMPYVRVSWRKAMNDAPGVLPTSESEDSSSDEE